MINYPRPVIDSNYVDNNWKLVYIEDDYKIAFFVEDSIEGARGDDWNDASYAHNAGAPYGPTRRLSFNTDYHSTPERNGLSLSVDEINGGEAAWLTPESWLPTALAEHARPIPAGIGMADFVKAVLLDGHAEEWMASVYAPVTVR